MTAGGVQGASKRVTNEAKAPRIQLVAMRGKERDPVGKRLTVHVTGTSLSGRRSREEYKRLG